MFKTEVTGNTNRCLFNTLKKVFEISIWSTFERCSNRFKIKSHYAIQGSIVDQLKPYYRYVDRSFLRECRVLASVYLVDDLCEFDKLEENTLSSSEFETEFLVHVPKASDKIFLSN